VGEFADELIDQGYADWGDDFFYYHDDEDSPPYGNYTKTCRVCRQRGLHWRLVGQEWKLYEWVSNKQVRHECNFKRRWGDNGCSRKAVSYSQGFGW
jgi:hypothetical protein